MVIIVSIRLDIMVPLKVGWILRVKNIPRDKWNI